MDIGTVVERAMSACRSLRVVLLASLLSILTGTSAHALSYLRACALNGIEFESEMVIGYNNPGTPMAPSTALLPSDDVWRMFGPPGLALESLGSFGGTMVGPTTRSPVGGTLADPSKDVVTGEVLNEFEFGWPVSGVDESSLDTFRIQVTGSASAVGALDAASSPADAVLEATARVEFYNEATPSTSPPYHCYGQILLPPLRPLAPYEVKYEIEVFEKHGPSGPFDLIYTHTAGSLGWSTLITPSFTYRLVLTYLLVVPHGEDPPFDAQLAFTVEEDSSVPVPSASWLTLLALAASLLFVGVRLGKRSPAKNAA